MENNDNNAFDKYYTFRSKSAPNQKECNDECQKNIICGIRAGKSELRCDYEPDVLFGGEQVQRRQVYQQEEHNCALNLVSINSKLFG
jgi:sphingomyelin phosphodiesterase